MKRGWAHGKIKAGQQAFNFYRSVFGTEFIGGIMRFKDVTPQEDMPPMPQEMANLVMHIELPILAGHILMGTDAPPSMGFSVNFGNNTYVMLEPDTREKTKRIFDLLSDNAKIDQPLQDMFWGAYFGSLKDKFGVQWMSNCSAKYDDQISFLPIFCINQLTC